MIDFLSADMAPIMFMGLIVFMLVGYSVAFSLAACGLFFGFIGIKLGLLPASLMQALPLRIFGIMQNDTLLAIPFFTFMGLILERSGMAEDLLDTIGQLFGPIRGGLAYAVILVGAMLAATTGVVAASVISMGLISLPIMLRYGYDRRVAGGVIAASGTLAQIIPPSLVLIVMADQLGQSVGDLYKGAFIPGFVLTGLYVGYVLVASFVKPALVPALPAEARTIREDNGKRACPRWRLLFVASRSRSPCCSRSHAPQDTPTDELIVVSMCVGVGAAFAARGRQQGPEDPPAVAHGRARDLRADPAAGLIFLVLGTIFLGIATPTEGGAMGAVGALAMAIARRRLDLKLLRQAMDTTMKLSCFVVFILLGSTVFSLSFQARRRPALGRAPADQPARRPARLPHRRQHPDLPARLLPRLLRAFVHRHPADRAGGAEARHRPGLVRRAARGQHADLVHAPAVRLRAVLPAQRGAARRLQGPCHGQACRR